MKRNAENCGPGEVVKFRDLWYLVLQSHTIRSKLVVLTCVPLSRVSWPTARVDLSVSITLDWGFKLPISGRIYSVEAQDLQNTRVEWEESRDGGKTGRGGEEEGGDSGGPGL